MTLLRLRKSRLQILLRRAVGATAGLLLGSLSLYGQATGSLEGTVKNIGSQPVPGAVVSLLAPSGDQPVVPDVVTDEAGHFRFNLLAQSSYRIRVKSSGFADLTTEVHDVFNGRESHVDLALSTRQVTVVVTDKSVFSLTPDLSLSTSFAELRNLPSIHRDPLELIQTLPGVTDNKAAPVTINALRPTFTNVTLDGINIQDNYIRSNGLRLSPNRIRMGEVEQFTLVTSNGSVADGFGAAQVAFVTPSGANWRGLHGSAFWLNSNNKMNANNWFANARGQQSAFRYNNGGFQLGGPLVRDRLAFFLSYEQYKQNDWLSTQQHALSPEMATRLYGLMAQYSNSLDPTGAAIANKMVQAGLQSRPLSDGSVYGILNSHVRQNTIHDNLVGRLDYTFSPRNAIALTYHWNDINDDMPEAGLTPGLSDRMPVGVTGPRNLVTAAWRFSPSSAFTHELRAGGNFTMTRFDRRGASCGRDVTVFQGFSEKLETTDSGSIRPSPSLQEGYVDDSFLNPCNPTRSIYIDGGSGRESFAHPSSRVRTLERYFLNYPDQARRTNTWNLASTSGLQLNRHSIRFGYQGQMALVSTSDARGTAPTYVIDGLNDVGQPSVGTFLGNLLAGNVLWAQRRFYSNNIASYSPGPAARHYRTQDHALYFTDKFRATNSLTLSAGIRYEVFPTLYVKNNMMLAPNAADLLSPAASYLNTDGSSLYRTGKKNFAPSFGFAWRPAAGSTVIRGGYSISHVNDNLLRTIENSLSQNYGLARLNGTDQATSLSDTPVIDVPNWNSGLLGQVIDQAESQRSLAAVYPRLRTPYVQQWNLAVQRQIGTNHVLEVRYVGNHAIKLLKAQNENPQYLSPEFLQAFRDKRDEYFTTGSLTNSGALGQFIVSDFFSHDGWTDPGRAFRAVLFNEPALLASLMQQNSLYNVVNTILDPDFKSTAGRDASRAINAYNLRLRNMAALDGAFLLGNSGSSTYHSGQVEMRGHTRRNGLTYQASYTFSKALTNSLGVQSGGDAMAADAYRDAYNPRLDKSRSPFDLRHSFKAAFQYAVPLGGRFSFLGGAVPSALFRNWNIGGVVIWQSGAPYSILTNAWTGSATSYNTVDPVLSGAALTSAAKFRITGDGPTVLPSDVSTAFAMAPAARLGALQPNYFSGPASFNADLSLGRTFALSERFKTRFRMEALNVFNHPNFGVSDQRLDYGYNGGTGNTFVDRYSSPISTLYTPRRVQLHLELSF